MSLEDLSKQFKENLKNSKGTIVTFSLKENYDTTVCFEFGVRTGGKYGSIPCLKSEKVNLKKGNEFKTTSFFIANDTSPDGVYRGVSVKESYLNMRYKDKDVQIPMSVINIIKADSISQSDAKSFVGNVITNYSENTSQSTGVPPQTFLQKNKTNLLIIGVLVLGYLAYKKFNK
jgi:hypothetical protein